MSRDRPNGGRPFVRTPLFMITMAIIACNILAYVFFFNFDSTLPRTANGAHYRMQLKLHTLHDRMWGPPAGEPHEPIATAHGSHKQPQQQQQLQQQHRQQQQKPTKSGITSQPIQSQEQTGAHAHNDKHEAVTESAHSAHGTSSSTVSSPDKTQEVSSQHVPVQAKVQEARQRLKQQLLEQRKKASEQLGAGGTDAQKAASLMSAVRTEDIAVALGSVMNVLNMKKRAKGTPIQVVAADGTTVQDPDAINYPLTEFASNQTEWPLWWFAPFFDRTSFGKEAATLVLGSLRSGEVQEKDMWLGTSQGNCNYGVDTSMPRVDFDQLEAAKNRADIRKSAIVICHSLPPFWARPKNRWETCAPCPPVGYTAAVAVGRAMAETDIYHSEFVKYCNRMDEVWVPSQFSYDVLSNSGVDAEKLRIVPIAVNTTLYDPARVKPLLLPVGDLVFGEHKRYVLAPYPPPRPPGLPSPPTTPAPSAEELQKHFKEIKGNRHRAVEHAAVIPGGASDDAHKSEEGGGQGGGRKLMQLDGLKAQLEELQKQLEQRQHTEARKLGVGSKGVGQVRVVSGASQGHLVKQQAHSVERTRQAEQLAGRLNSWAAALRTQQLLYPRPPPPAAPPRPPFNGRKPFTFVSTFKWEMRKGWDVLLAAYLQEFTADDDVELYILTKPFMTGNDFKGDMHVWAQKHLNITQEQHIRLPALYVISAHMTNEEYSGLYKSADAFVIATRGEGWGMPITEAMSMGIPVVVTNWSGVTAFVDDTVGYMVNYTLSKVPDDQPWWFRGARWADASVEHLRQVLRRVQSNREEAMRKGRLARERMVSLYSPEALGKIIAKEHARLQDMLRSGKCDRCHTSGWVAPPGDRTTNYYSGREEFISTGGKMALSHLTALSAAADFGSVQKINIWKHIIATVGQVGNDDKRGEDTDTRTAAPGSTAGTVSSPGATAAPGGQVDESDDIDVDDSTTAYDGAGNKVIQLDKVLAKHSAEAGFDAGAALLAKLKRIQTSQVAGSIEGTQAGEDSTQGGDNGATAVDDEALQAGDGGGQGEDSENAGGLNQDAEGFGEQEEENEGGQQEDGDQSEIKAAAVTGTDGVGATEDSEGLSGPGKELLATTSS